MSINKNFAFQFLVDSKTKIVGQF